MKRIQCGAVSAVTLLLLFATLACTHSLKEETFTAPQAQMELLIAGDASEYKDLLRSAIIDNYRERANIRVVNIDKLGQAATEDFHVILIIDTCLAWTRFNPTVLAFIEKPQVKDKVVWFMTVDDTDERYQHNGIDAITAASAVENRPQVTKQLIRRIDAILSSKP